MISHYKGTYISSRKYNADAIAYQPITDNTAIALIADACGDDSASSLLVQTFCYRMAMLLLEMDFTKSQEEVEREISKTIKDLANKLPTSFVLDEKKHFKWVFALAISLEDSLILAHMGDCRVYRIKQSSISKTIDHTVVERIGGAGNDALTRVLCYQCDKPVEISFQTALCPEEVVVLCTDGFWKNSKDESLQLLSSAADKGKFLENLFNDAKDKNVQDNMSLVSFWYN